MNLKNSRHRLQVFCLVVAFAVTSLAIAVVSLAFGKVTADEPTTRDATLRTALLRAEQVTDDRLASLATEGFSAVVLKLAASADAARDDEARAARRIVASGLALHYWIEIAHSPEFADAHPEWMASLQGHEEWRRFFPDVAKPAEGEVVKNYPWVPIFYREAFDAHRDRVARLLADKPPAAVIFLNDLQAAPSACGCGHPLCRWTTDYGPKLTATKLGPDAAARFVLEVKRLAPDSRIVPVWAIECEEHDKDGVCGGVGCFQGICWKAFTQQLMPVMEQTEQLGVLLPYKLFERDLPVYGGEAAWITHALRLFETMPPVRGGKVVPVSKLIAVLQGWDVSPNQIQAQIQHATNAGAAGFVVAFDKIDQSWQPRVISMKPQ